ncbi:hypothetical protein N7504_010709 [Penicillium tannophilum]|nr:hypothetical protein N7504_010709 [Penicillium tannophilum]
MSDPGEYTVGWICALYLEYIVARTVLDEEYESPRLVSPNDTNVYTLGRIGKHKVAMTFLPDAEFGTASAAIVAANMLNTFHNIKIGLMVGIAGGLPSRSHDIRLGDVVVNALHDGKGGFIQHDFKMSFIGRIFQQTRSMNHLHPMLFTAITRLQAKYERNANQLEALTNRILDENVPLRYRYRRPPPTTDRLFKAEVIHDLECCDESCIKDPSKLVPRGERDGLEPKIAIHYGQVASADQSVKDAFIRDGLAAHADILCFGREAPELMSFLPCLVIQGICDYSDSHKNKTWQGYAAMTAAAYAKDLLCHMTTHQVEKEGRALEIHRPPTEQVGKTTDRIDDKSSMLEEPQDYIGRPKIRHPRRIEELLESAAAFKEKLYEMNIENDDTARLLNMIITAEQPFSLFELDANLGLQENTRKEWMIHNPMMATWNISHRHVQKSRHLSQSAWRLLQLASILDALGPRRKILSTFGLYLLRGLNDPPPTHRNRSLQKVASAQKDPKEALRLWGRSNPGQESTGDTSNIPRVSEDTPIYNDQNLPPTSSKGKERSSDSSTTKKTLDVARYSKTLQPSDGQARFLALCVNTGTIYKTLAEIETSNVKSDAAAFSMLKDEYLKIRGMRSRFRFLVEPIDIEFIQFTLWNLRGGYISVCDRPNCVPPDNCDEYEFSRLPQPRRPMPPDLFIHYLGHGPGDLNPSRMDWLPNLPKRKDKRVIDCGEACLGWGMHIIEGPNRVMIFWIMMVTILASILTSVLWSAIRGDVQGGTGMGTLIVALPSAILTAFLFRLEGI